jgi:hypothetical protein
MSPTRWCKDCGIARRRKLFLGAELERGVMVLDYPFVWPPMEHRGEFAPANLQAEFYLEREHNVRWAVLGVGHATSGITAKVLKLLLPRSIFADASTDRIPHSEFSLRTLIGTAFPQRNVVSRNAAEDSQRQACSRSLSEVDAHANSSILMFALTICSYCDQ